MNLPMTWLKEFVDIDCSIKDFADAMTLSGSKVESIENKGDIISNVVVGKVLSIEKHPDADKLLVVQTDIGKDEPIQIVTGATNLFVGAYVPVALDGATLSGGLKIKKSKLRGVISNGMFCSVEEFGFNRNDYPEAPENGIYIFEKEHTLGSCIKPILEIDEDVVEFEITSNRADCFSILGLAREASATFKKPLRLPNMDFNNSSKESIKDYINIEVKNTDICKRYTCCVIKNVKIGNSPQWLRHRLTASGIKPINNIVDITNYVMLELGQPMHAYDLGKISGNKLTIRNALKNEKLKTLDGIEREFDESILVIEDSQKLVDLAGIMGGENSMITKDTKTILLESANFEGNNIRISAKKLGLRTDASSKYEKCLDPNLSILALNRACNLIEQLGIGEIIEEIIDIYPNPLNEWEISYSYERINKLLGTNISEKEMIDILSLIDIKSNGKIAKIPTFRTDLETETDLAEEIARFYGYDKIEETLSTGTPTVGKKSYKQNIIDIITDTLVSSGLNEALNYSFESPKVFEKLNIPKDSDYRNVVTISNPLGEDFSIMRTTTLNSMLNSISINYNRRNKQAHLFEIGKIYIPKQLPLSELPIENELVSIAMYGNTDFYDAKGVFQNIFNALGINKVQYIALNDENYNNLPFMHKGRTAIILDENNNEIGYLGEIHPKVANNYDIQERVYYGILKIDYLEKLSNLDRIFKALPKFPSMQRDIAILVKDEITVNEIESVIRTKGTSLLEDVELFDIYKGEQIESGFKSIAYSITFRAEDRTLKEEEINSIMQKILKELEQKLNAKLR